MYKLNKNKFPFKVKEVSYVEHLLERKGVKPVPEKVTSIFEMSTPDDVSSLRPFLRMVT